MAENPINRSSDQEQANPGLDSAAGVTPADNEQLSAESADSTAVGLPRSATKPIHIGSN